MSTTSSQHDDDSFDLKGFKVERVLSEDPLTHNSAILGTLKNASGESIPTIVRIEQATLPSFSTDLLDQVKLLGINDIYSWGLGWLKKSDETADIKINVISPATEVHIRKYTNQKVHIIHETSKMYADIVKPYIDAFPPARTKWVEDILTGRHEAEKVLYRSATANELGFLILPDMKWDLTTIASLYLVAITLVRDIKSMRDLNQGHIGMLKDIRRQAHAVVKQHYGLEPSEIRCYVHYQPSYYHFHVHIVNANFTGLAGMSVGQAHLLDDLISMLELDPPTGPSTLQRMTLTYALGEQHGLFAALRAAQEPDAEA
ncbi:scavenger mRNA decapping enzyme [Dentipellis sp. KUC8613]|nr:scavenger mRNA decapping enzyme [Dentipellis sp. KUC8613]